MSHKKNPSPFSLAQQIEKSKSVEVKASVFDGFTDNGAMKFKTVTTRVRLYRNF